MSTQHINLQIDGMTCQACASRIEKVLNKKDFVANASVNFAGETAQVEYDDAQTTPEELMQIIQKTGYQAALKTSALPEMQPENANPLAQPLALHGCCLPLPRRLCWA